MLAPPHSLHLLLMRWCGQSFRVSPPAVPSAAAPGPLSRDRLTTRPPPSVPPVTCLAPAGSLVLAPGSPGALVTFLSTLSSRPSPPLSRICSTLHEPAPAVLSAHKRSSSDTAISPRPACGSLSPPRLMTARLPERPVTAVSNFCLGFYYNISKKKRNQVTGPFDEWRGDVATSRRRDGRDGRGGGKSLLRATGTARHA